MALSPDKEEFFRFLLQVGALQFGAFTLKSGRVSPYFFNAARFRTGRQLQRLGEFYAKKLREAAPEATIIFGPAYKGIPICISAALALSHTAGRTGNDAAGGAEGREIGYLFNRKEEKAHGDQGIFVGQLPEPGQRLALVDDVITDGKTKLEAVALLRSAFDAPIDALVIAFDRMERNSRDGNALLEFEAETGIPVAPIFSLADLETLLAQPEKGGPAEAAALPSNLLEEIRAYRERYGVAERV